MKCKKSARDLLNHPDFESLGAMTVPELYGVLRLNGVTNQELRNSLNEIRSQAVKIDKRLGGLIVLPTQSYFSMTLKQREGITERDTDLVALHGRRAVGLLVVDRKIKHHETLFRIYTKLLVRDWKDRGGRIADKVEAHQGLLTSGFKRDIPVLLGVVKSFKELQTLQLRSQ